MLSSGDENDLIVGYESEQEAIADMLHEDETMLELDHTDEDFGVKTIGTFAGWSLMVNNLSGPGIVLLPSLFIHAGFASSLTMLVVVSLLSGFSASMLAESMKYIPGNKHFDERIEYTALCKFYLGKYGYWIVQLFLNLSLLALNLVSILLTVEVMDRTLVRIFKCTWGLVLVPADGTHVGFNAVCPTAQMILDNTANSPFGNSMVISVGYLIVILLIVPMGYFNLDENMGIQIFALVVQVLIMAQWLITFTIRGLDVSSVRAFGEPIQQGQVLGQMVLNYAAVMTVPSWLNEKRRSSNVNKVVWYGLSFSAVQYILVGVMGAMAFPHLGVGEDILTALNKADDGSKILNQIGTYVFPLVAIASGIPVYSIIVRYNLLENKVCGKALANFFAVILPWMLAIPLSAGNQVFLAVANYSSLLFSLPINFVFPFVIYVLAMRRKAFLKPCYCEPNAPCEHDYETVGVNDDSSINRSVNLPKEAPLMESVDYEETTPLMFRTKSVMIGTKIVTHRHVKSEEGVVRAEQRKVAAPKWSEKNPKMARYCCQKYVDYKNKPKVNPLASFTLRHPELAARLPVRFVAWLDLPEKPAPEHFALPKRLRPKPKQIIGLVAAVFTFVLMIAALGLAIWQSIDGHPPLVNATIAPTNHSNLTGAYIV
jgi:amino acid permease